MRTYLKSNFFSNGGSVDIWSLKHMDYCVRTTKGKSLPFLILIFAGYICGIIGKLHAPSCKWYVLFFYILNCVMIGTDLLLYVRNYHLDSLEKQRGK